MHQPRALVKALLLVVSAIALGTVPLGSASASCVAPALEVSTLDRSAAAPLGRPLRSPFVVSGTAFHSGCDDTGQGSGCRAPRSGEAPLEHVALVLEQGTRVAVLATADASSRGEDYRITWSVEVPSTFTAGPAVLRAAGAALPIDLQG